MHQLQQQKFKYINKSKFYAQMRGTTIEESKTTRRLLGKFQVSDQMNRLENCKTVSPVGHKYQRVKNSNCTIYLPNLSAQPKSSGFQWKKASFASVVLYKPNDQCIYSVSGSGSCMEEDLGYYLLMSNKYNNLLKKIRLDPKCSKNVAYWSS